MKNILFVTYDFPYPTNSGGKNRAYNLIKSTSSQSNIFLFSFVRDGFDQSYIEELKKIGVRKVFIYKRKKLKSPKTIISATFSSGSVFKNLYYEKKAEDQMFDIIREEKIDVVHFESSYTGFYISRKIKDLGAKQILGTENIEYLLYEDYLKKIAKPYTKAFISFQIKRFKKEEEDMFCQADVCAAVTEKEAEAIHKFSSKKPIILPNGIDFSEFKSLQKREWGGRLLFVGNFTYFPNVSAIKFFYEKVFGDLDNFSLTIVGKGSQRLSINDPKVRVLEFVEDIKEEYNKADVFVFPLTIGGGTNFKILEAMASGVPIVANPGRLEGLKAEDGKHFLSAIDSSDYKKQILKLKEDKNLRDNLVANARKLVEENYSWDKIGRALLEIWGN